MNAISLRTPAWLAALLGCCALAGTAQPASAKFGDARTFAPFPSDAGAPEGIAIRGGRVYVSGGAGGSSAVIVYDLDTRAVVRRYDGVGNSGLAFDRSGRLYILSGLGLVRLNTATGARETYGSPLPDLKPCIALIVRPPCSPTPTDMGPIANELVLAADGDAYASDSGQATIWRYPKGGGAPRIWFQDSRLATTTVSGVNGIRIDETGSRMFMAVTLDTLLASSVYSLPLVARPVSRQLTLVRRLPIGDGADGIAFGARGELYVAMGSPLSHGVMILRRDGTQRARLRNPLGSLLSPFNGPADIAFDGSGRILVTNRAFFVGLVLPRYSVAVADVDDPGAPLFQPAIP